jgi:hypothetical protein
MFAVVKAGESFAGLRANNAEVSSSKPPGVLY